MPSKPYGPASKTRQDGAPGERRVLLLETRVLADVVLVGLPNVGKSSLVAALTGARAQVRGCCENARGRVRARHCCCRVLVVALTPCGSCRAPAQVGSYAFTTLRPQLGVLRYPDGASLTMADAPGDAARRLAASALARLLV